MGVLIQIRDTPDETHRRLKARAAAAGVSMSEYLRAILIRAASRPTPSELAGRIAARGAVTVAGGSESVVRSIRDRGE